MPKPENKAQLESFLGLVCYYRRFIKNLTAAERPLRDICKEKSFIWTKIGDVSFEVIKELIAHDTLLSYPDPTRTVIVDTEVV